MPSEKNQATAATVNMHKKFGEVWTCGSKIFVQTDRQTDRQRQTDRLITILHSHNESE